MIETDGDRKWCHFCKEYKASVRERVWRCSDVCLCQNEYDACDPCAIKEELTDE